MLLEKSFFLKWQVRRIGVPTPQENWGVSSTSATGFQTPQEAVDALGEFFGRKAFEGWELQHLIESPAGVRVEKAP